MTVVNIQTGELIAHGDVRASVKRAREHGERFFEEVIWQVENQAWIVLGYADWDTMRDAEYGDLGVAAPRSDVPQLASRLRSNGFTQAQIGVTLGVPQQTISRHLNTQMGNQDPAPPIIVNARGQERPPSYQRPARPAIVDAEIVEDTKPRATPRRALSDQARDAGQELRKAVERVERVAADDRLTPNKEQVAAHLRHHLTNAIEVCQDLLDRLNN